MRGRRDDEGKKARRGVAGRAAVVGAVVRATVVCRAGTEVVADTRVGLVVGWAVVVLVAGDERVGGVAAFDPSWRESTPMNTATTSPTTIARPI